MLYRDLSQELVMDGVSAELRLRVPFVEKAEIELKKIGLELVVRVGGAQAQHHAAVARWRRTGRGRRKLEDGHAARALRAPGAGPGDPAPARSDADRRRPFDGPWRRLLTTPFSSLRRTGRRAAGRPAAGERSRSSTSASTSARSAARRTCCARPLPAEFQEHWHALQREGLLAARTLIDHYIRHLESQRASAAPVEDIPIE